VLHSIATEKAIYTGKPAQPLIDIDACAHRASTPRWSLFHPRIPFQSRTTRLFPLLQPFHIYGLRAFFTLLDTIAHPSPIRKIWCLARGDARAMEKDLLTARVNNEPITLLGIIPLDIPLVRSRSKLGDD
jgi:hypothetical protein